MAMYDTGKILLYAAGEHRHGLVGDRPERRQPDVAQGRFAQSKRKKFSTVVLPDGRVMAIGGSTDGTSTIAKAVLTPEVWDPATESWTTLPEPGGAPHVPLQRRAPGRRPGPDGGRRPDRRSRRPSRAARSTARSTSRWPTGRRSPTPGAPSWTAGGTVTLDGERRQRAGLRRADGAAVGNPRPRHHATAARAACDVGLEPGNGSVGVRVRRSARPRPGTTTRSPWTAGACRAPPASSGSSAAVAPPRPPCPRRARRRPHASWPTPKRQRRTDRPLRQPGRSVEPVRARRAAARPHLRPSADLLAACDTGDGRELRPAGPDQTASVFNSTTTTIPADPAVLGSGLPGEGVGELGLTLRAPWDDEARHRRALHVRQRRRRVGRGPLARALVVRHPASRPPTWPWS